ncbi:YHYH protein [Cellulophaga tyrosinoxydans]|uniref:YHYH protein n=1 Tax=Cellulophaga tyrosinoxydans TaxID=504486 RepID=A0A1W2BK61_9FLAO|nr:YHYH protein [Cellulophaga tyrosinoxydans]SMC73226.1 YHYH protein [Cellulophaga tyrosinoxydans]
MINKKIIARIVPSLVLLLTITVSFFACSSDSSTDSDTEIEEETVTELHAAYSAFNTDATTIYLDGSEVVIETTGLPNHETVYWGEGNTLYKDEPDVARTPSIMSSNNNATTIRVDATPNKTGSTVTTQLGTIGIAVSGASIFNDQEGNGALNQAAASLDWTGAHIGPGVYHYHLEPKAFTNDDANLVGILLDGVFLYGRKCNASGAYPTDLDASGGHTSATQYTDGAEEYHYHIINEVYSTTGSYIAFAGPYRGY